MDGRVRLRAFVTALPLVGFSFVTPKCVAEDTEKRLPSTLPSYVSPYLEDRFLGAISLSIKVDGAEAAKSRKAELELSSIDTSSGEGSGELKARLIPVRLEEISDESDSQSDNSADPNCRAFKFVGLPAELLKAGGALKLVILPPTEDQKHFARLLLCGSDGKKCRQINLMRVAPSEPVILESSKRAKKR